MSTVPDPPLPVGAAEVSEWEPDRFGNVRRYVFYRWHGNVVPVRVWAMQTADGGIPSRWIEIDDADVCLDRLCPHEALGLVKALVEAVTEIKYAEQEAQR